MRKKKSQEDEGTKSSTTTYVDDYQDDAVVDEAAKDDVYMQSFPYGSTRFCFGVPPGHLWSHLAVAVSIWLVLLYLPQLSRLLAIRSRSAA